MKFIHSKYWFLRLLWLEYLMWRNPQFDMDLSLKIDRVITRIEELS